MDKAADQPSVKPVRSAKEAINAMYAEDSSKRLSSYLATSAKEIINASAASSKASADPKSAASLHHASSKSEVSKKESSSSKRQLESTRPSASALLQPAKADKITAPIPVVHTSLKLDPKKPPTVITPRSARATNSRATEIARATARPLGSKGANSLNPPTKRQTKIDISSDDTPVSPTVAAISSIKQAAAVATAKPTANSPRSAAIRNAQLARTGGLISDISRPRASYATSTFDSQNSINEQNSTPAQGIIKRSSFGRRSKDKLPADSVKRRFRLAPKGFAVSKSDQARTHKFLSFSNPDYSTPLPEQIILAALPESIPSQSSQLAPSPSSIDIYGLSDAEPDTNLTSDFAPDPVLGAISNSTSSGNSATHGTAPLGVVADYRPQGDSVENSHFTERAVASGSGAASPDNSRYALGGQSPFFLKTVNVEKRPLSSTSARPREAALTPVYASQDLSERYSTKNLYTKNPKPAKKPTKSRKTTRQDLPARPTVIIPASRRSHTPLFLLLILTVIVGAAVGATIYLCFFE